MPDWQAENPLGAEVKRNMGIDSLLPQSWKGKANLAVLPVDETAASLYARLKHRKLLTGCSQLDSIYGSIDSGQVLEVLSVQHARNNLAIVITMPILPFAPLKSLRTNLAAAFLCSYY